MKNKKNKPYIMIAAGGSGGHLFSADAVSNELRKRNYRIILLTDKRVKRFLNNFKADKIILVPSDTFTNKGFIKWPQVAFKLLLGFFISLFWIILTRPILSIGFGGYPSLPPLLASKLLGRKIIIHEQNTVFGRANNFLCSYYQAFLFETLSCCCNRSNIPCGDPSHCLKNGNQSSWT